MKWAIAIFFIGGLLVAGYSIKEHYFVMHNQSNICALVGSAYQCKNGDILVGSGVRYGGTGSIYDKDGYLIITYNSSRVISTGGMGYIRKYLKQDIGCSSDQANQLCH